MGGLYCIFKNLRHHVRVLLLTLRLVSRASITSPMRKSPHSRTTCRRAHWPPGGLSSIIKRYTDNEHKITKIPFDRSSINGASVTLLAVSRASITSPTRKSPHSRTTCLRIQLPPGDLTSIMKRYTHARKKWYSARQRNKSGKERSRKLTNY